MTLCSTSGEAPSGFPGNFKGALLTVLDKKATTAYVKAKEQLLLKNGLLYRKTNIGPAKETIFQFVVPQRHRSAAMDGCHHEAAHQGQRRSPL